MQWRRRSQRPRYQAPQQQHPECRGTL